MATINSIGSNIPIEIPKGGTAVASTTAYGVLCGGTSSTSALQNAGTGTTGQFLVSQGSSALPQWTTTSGGVAGALVLLQTQVITSNVATVDFTTGFSTSYVNYMITIDAYWPAFNGNSDLLMEVSDDAGVTWQNSGYKSGVNHWQYASNTLVNASSTAAFLIFSQVTSDLNSPASDAQIWFNNIDPSFATPGQSSITGEGTTANGGTYGQIMAGTGPSIGVVTGLRFLSSNGDIALGTFSLYALTQ